MINLTEILIAKLEKEKEQLMVSTKKYVIENVEMLEYLKDWLILRTARINEKTIEIKEHKMFVKGLKWVFVE